MIVASRRQLCRKLRAFNFCSRQNENFQPLFFSSIPNLTPRDPLSISYKQVGNKLVELKPYKETTTTLEYTHHKLEIKAIFDERVTSQIKFDRFMKERLSNANPQIIAEFMRAVAKKGDAVPVTRKHLNNIGLRMEEIATSFRWDYRNLAFLMSGLQQNNENDPGFIRIIAAVSRITNAVNKSDKIPQSASLTMFFNGLRNTNFTDVETRGLIPAIVTMVDKCSDAFTAQTIGCCLFGMKGMNTTLPHVRALLSALIAQIERCDVPLDSQATSNALYGLNQMDSETPEVREMLAVLLPKVVSCRGTLNAQGLGNAIYGLKEMHDDNPEVLGMLKALAVKVRASKSALDAWGFASAMYGLKNMDAHTAETREMLSAITEKISVYKITLTSQSIGNCLYGMKRMSSHYPEVRAMLAALLPLLQNSTQPMSAQELSNAIYGMQMMSVKYEEVSHVLTAITVKLAECSDDLNGQCLVSMMSGLQCMDFKHPAVSGVLLAIGPKIESSAEVFEVDALCFAVYKLRNITKNETAGSKAILSAIAKKLEQVDTGASLNKLQMASIGLKQMDENSPEVIALQAALKRFVPQLPSAHSKTL
jgi:hypothetical protein